MESFIIFLIISTLICFLLWLLGAKDKNIFGKIIALLLGIAFQLIVLVIFPLLYILFGSFHPEHQLSICTLISMCVIAFFIVWYKKKIFPPVIEVLLNSLLVIGCILSIIILAYIANNIDGLFALIFCAPIALLFIRALHRSHNRYSEYMEEVNIEPQNKYEEAALIMLTSRMKYLYLVATGIFILAVIVSALTLFGQELDSLILAFTYQTKF